MQNVGDLVNLALENSNRRGVGQHQRRGLFVHLGRQSLQIDAALGVRLQVLDRIAADGRRGRVGSVGRVGNQNLAPRIAARLVPGPHQQDAREFPVRPGSRLQGDRVHAGDFLQAALQQVDDLQSPLRQRVRPVGVRLGQALDAGHQLVHPRVVLHGAGAQRVHAQVDGIVPRREPREVPDELDLAQLRQLRRRLPVRFAQQRRRVHSRHVQRRQLIRAFPWRRFLEQQSLVLRLVRTDLAEGVAVRSFRCLCHDYLSSLKQISEPRH